MPRIAALVALIICISLAQRTQAQRNKSDDNQQAAAAEQKATTEAVKEVAATLRAMGEQAAQIQAAAAKQQPRHWYDPFWPDHISDWSLFLVGVGGIIVAVRTLEKLERQTKATEDAATAAKDSSDMLAFLNRAEFDCKNWKADVRWIQAANPGYTEGVRVQFTFDAKNVGSTSARIDNYVLCIQPDSSGHRFRRQPAPYIQDSVVVPEQGYPISSEVYIWTGEEEALFRTKGIRVYIWGVVHFTDRTGKHRWKRFGRQAVCQDHQDTVFHMITRPGFNCDDEWHNWGKPDEEHFEPQDWP